MCYKTDKQLLINLNFSVKQEIILLFGYFSYVFFAWTKIKVIVSAKDCFYVVSNFILYFKLLVQVKSMKHF